MIFQAISLDSAISLFYDISRWREKQDESLGKREAGTSYSSSGRGKQHPLSSAFYALLQGLEVTLRNAIHAKMAEAFARDHWYESEVMEEAQKKSIRKAKKQIVLNGKEITPGRIVAQVTFAFWVELCGPIYAQTLWDAHLKSIFAVPMGRKTAYRRLDKIRKLRNRIAHHESILERSLKDDFALIVETIHWLCPVTAMWLKSNAFHPTFAAMPSCPKA